ncbi:osteoclast-associated immunoglobulin-like receptor [Carcharodon carcharias]|uniref:osteoclast-associated immunoglobulin-like receptor n=1 Tax=Carcharodon carcharias TaxID=13397 RepID=UPI001B7F3984|nr:osteoclast-associated immunoglobulin-like receptor [Carcharodon carcharias]
MNNRAKGPLMVMIRAKIKGVRSDINFSLAPSRHILVTLFLISQHLSRLIISPGAQPEKEAAGDCFPMPVYGLNAILQMAVTSSLLLIMASLGVGSVDLPKPTLSMDPPSSIILPGEEFSLTCHFPFTDCHGDFYRNEELSKGTFFGKNHTAVIHIRQETTWKGLESYNCKYRKYFSDTRTWLRSEFSEPVQFTVTGELPKPTVSMEPASGVVTVGERVRIKCSATYPSHISRLYRTHHQTPIDTQNVSGSDWSVNFTITDADTNDSGQYNCTSERTVSGTAYVSPPSDSLDLTVKDTLPVPHITVEPPSGVVGRGVPFRLKCTGSILRSGGRFNFYRDGEGEWAVDVHGFVQSASCTINGMNTTGTVNYTCGYARIVKETVYPSPRSDPVQVTVTGDNVIDHVSEIRLCLLVFVLVGIGIILGIEFNQCKSKKDVDGCVVNERCAEVTGNEETAV